MDEHLYHSEHENIKKNSHSGQQDELAGALKDDGEIMKEDINIFIKLAQYYYDTEWSIDYGELTWEEVQVGYDAHLYTLINYKGKDILVQVGSGEYNIATFTKSGVEKTRRLHNSPLPLFVVTARADQEHKDSHPRKFLNEHAMMYSPKWGLIETRMTCKERQQSIDYGKSNGIMTYEKAKAVLQSAIVRKKFFDRKVTNKVKKWFIDEMKILKTKDFEQFIRRYEVKPEFYKHDIKSVAFREFLTHIGEGKLAATYKLIQQFDLQTGTFTPPHDHSP